LEDGIGSSAYTTIAGGGAITADDIMAIYFSLNRAYRNNPKTAWLMSDATYQTIRSSLALANCLWFSMSRKTRAIADKMNSVSSATTATMT
jgi:hypothetical protein